jgi:hypothetical protein
MPRDVACSGAYVFIVTFTDGFTYRDLFTLSALGVTNLADAKREVQRLAAEYSQCPTTMVASVTASKSSERFM